MQEFDQISINVLNLPSRIHHALVRGGVSTIGALKDFYLNRSKYRVRNFGEKSFSEISKVLDELSNASSLLDIMKQETVQSHLQEDNLPKRNHQIAIEGLRLPPAIRDALKKHGIKTMDDFIKASDSQLLNINPIRSKELKKSKRLLSEFSIGEPATFPAEEAVIKIEEKTITWAQIAEDYFQNEKVVYSYVLISRFGYSPKTLENIATELGITRERVRQIQERAAVRYLKHIRFSGAAELLEKVENVFATYGDGLSLSSFKSLLKKEGVLGQFSQTISTEHIKDVDLLETMICWLNLISNKKYTLRPIEFSIDITELAKSGKVSIRDHVTLMNISRRDIKKIRRKVLFTGGITIKEASKILSKDEKITVLALKNLNFQKIDDEWFTIKRIAEEQDNSKIPLRIAGLKMLAVNPIMKFDSFHDGIRRHASRFYSGIAPAHVVEHVLPLFGFNIKNYEVSTQLSTKGILSKSEQCFISAINKNNGVASFLEIAEEFFLHNLSLPAVSATLKRSPIVEKINEGFYKLRGADISWQKIEEAQKRQKRFAQDEEITHGLDGVIRMRFTVNNYAFLTGVVGAHSIKGMAGLWSLVYKDKSYGEVKIAESYLWSLSKLFKELDVKMGDRIELGFNTWDRTLSVRKANNENT